MFEPVRGGTRGGQAEFKWSDVAQDKDREVRSHDPLQCLYYNLIDPIRNRITWDIV